MNPWIILAALLAIAGSGALGYRHGLEVQDGRHKAALFEQATAYAKAIVERQADADTLAQDLESARAAQKPRDRIITKEVVRYETIVPADRRCELDGAWRLLHDAAATGIPADPGAAGLAAPAADRVTDAAALETVAENYADCREWRGSLIGWQRWWAGLGQPVRQLLGRLPVIDLEHSQVPVPDHPGQAQNVQALGQPRDGLGPRVMEMQIGNPGPVA